VIPDPGGDFVSTADSLFLAIYEERGADMPVLWMMIERY
jgi:hypothetical protein